MNKELQFRMGLCAFIVIAVLAGYSFKSCPTPENKVIEYIPEVVTAEVEPIRGYILGFFITYSGSVAVHNLTAGEYTETIKTIGGKSEPTYQVNLKVSDDNGTLLFYKTKLIYADGFQEIGFESRQRNAFSIILTVINLQKRTFKDSFSRCFKVNETFVC